MAIWMVMLGGYLLGCCNGAIIVSRIFLKEDVRKHGSGNAGLTNFFRSYGGALTLLVVAVDAGKALLACLLGKLLLGSSAAAILGGACAVAGHMFPVFFGFRGGKGILSGAFVSLFLDWRIFVLIILVFILIVALTRYVSLGSILAASVYPFGFLWRFWGDWKTVLLAFAIAVGAIAMHHANIVRLAHGTERKLSLHREA